MVKLRLEVSVRADLRSRHEYRTSLVFVRIVTRVLVKRTLKSLWCMEQLWIYYSFQVTVPIIYQTKLGHIMTGKDHWLGIQ